MKTTCALARSLQEKETHLFREISHMDKWSLVNFKKTEITVEQSEVPGNLESIGVKTFVILITV